MWRRKIGLLIALPVLGYVAECAEATAPQQIKGVKKDTSLNEMLQTTAPAVDESEIQLDAIKTEQYKTEFEAKWEPIEDNDKIQLKSLADKLTEISKTLSTAPWSTNPKLRAEQVPAIRLKFLLGLVFGYDKIRGDLSPEANAVDIFVKATDGQNNMEDYTDVPHYDGSAEKSVEQSQTVQDTAEMTYPDKEALHQKYANDLKEKLKTISEFHKKKLEYLADDLAIRSESIWSDAQFKARQRTALQQRFFMILVFGYDKIKNDLSTADVPYIFEKASEGQENIEDYNDVPIDRSANILGNVAYKKLRKWAYTLYSNEVRLSLYILSLNQYKRNIQKKEIYLKNFGKLVEKFHLLRPYVEGEPLSAKELIKIMSGGINDVSDSKLDQKTRDLFKRIANKVVAMIQKRDEKYSSVAKDKKSIIYEDIYQGFVRGYDKIQSKMHHAEKFPGWLYDYAQSSIHYSWREIGTGAYDYAADDVARLKRSLGRNVKARIEMVADKIGHLLMAAHPADYSVYYEFYNKDKYWITQSVVNDLYLNYDKIKDQLFNDNLDSCILYEIANAVPEDGETDKFVIGQILKWKV